MGMFHLLFWHAGPIACGIKLIVAANLQAHVLGGWARPPSVAALNYSLLLQPPKEIGHVH